jgi:hypothetical protein
MATEFWPCFICETPTDRGSLLRLKGEWIAVPLCPTHKNAVADRVTPDTHVIDGTKLN